ncbi:MAG: hypothetical protein H7832_10460 [Magnetococcus sp. DMHC-6]
MPRALFSLHKPEYALLFFPRLKKLGWEIIASSESYDILKKNNMLASPLKIITKDDFHIPFPPTLHPLLEQALTLEHEEHRIDLVFVMPYPFEIGLDVGGHTLLGLACKGGRWPVCTPEDMEALLLEMETQGGVSVATHHRLMATSLTKIASFYMQQVQQMGPVTDGWLGFLAKELFEGENPYQKPAILYKNFEDPLGLAAFQQLSGLAPCFTNMADLDALVQSLVLGQRVFTECGEDNHIFLCLAAKHGNLVGFGCSRDDPEEAIELALFGSPRSIWGGEVITNFVLDVHSASRLLFSERRKKMLGAGSWILDIIACPAIHTEGIELFREKNQKILVNSHLSHPNVVWPQWQYRGVRGGWLRQPPYHFVMDLNKVDWLDEKPQGITLDSLKIAWVAAYSSNHGGNEVALAKDGYLLSCAGGPSTVEAVETVIQRAINNGHSLEGATFAANAFFPFTDAPEMLVNAGVKWGVVPAGGKKEPEVRNFFQKHDVRH